jgi:Fe-S-cluster containining protein
MTEDAIRKTCSFDVCRECTRSCCQDAKPPLTYERMRIIREYLKNQRRLLEQVFSHSDYSFPSVDANDFCVFYDKGTKECLIHAVKPETCRAGPVTFDINCRTGKVEWYLKKGSLCLLAGKLHETPEEFNAHLQVAKDEIMQLIRKLDSGALRTILTIDEPETFKIGEDDLPQEVLAKLALSDRL